MISMIQRQNYMIHLVKRYYLESNCDDIRISHAWLIHFPILYIIWKYDIVEFQNSGSLYFVFKISLSYLLQFNDEK
jgi:hypothetical protein